MFSLKKNVLLESDKEKSETFICNEFSNSFNSFNTCIKYYALLFPGTDKKSDSRQILKNYSFWALTASLR